MARIGALLLLATVLGAVIAEVSKGALGGCPSARLGAQPDILLYDSRDALVAWSERWGAWRTSDMPRRPPVLSQLWVSGAR